MARKIDQLREQYRISTARMKEESPRFFRAVSRKVDEALTAAGKLTPLKTANLVMEIIGKLEALRQENLAVFAKKAQPRVKTILVLEFRKDGIPIEVPIQAVWIGPGRGVLMYENAPVGGCKMVPGTNGYKVSNVTLTRSIFGFVNRGGWRIIRSGK